MGEATIVPRRDLEIKQGDLPSPIWWHQHGSKMRVREISSVSQFVVIGGSAAKVTVRQASSLYLGAKGWFVDWEVVHHNEYRPWKVWTQGRSQFSDLDLEAAFDLTDDTGTSSYRSCWLITKFGADVAEQGKYIRWKRFLNIPCPGTGRDGDPNVSVYLNKEIERIVRALLDTHARTLEELLQAQPRPRSGRDRRELFVLVNASDALILAKAGAQVISGIENYGESGRLMQKYLLGDKVFFWIQDSKSASFPVSKP